MIDHNGFDYGEDKPAANGYHEAADARETAASPAREEPEGLHEAATAQESATSNVVVRLIAMMQSNVNEAFEASKRCAAAGSFAELTEIQSAYWSRQTALWNEQLEELRDMMSVAAAEGFEPFKKHFSDQMQNYRMC